MSPLSQNSRGRDAARAYGADLAACFGLSEAPSHVQRTLRRGLLAVSELNLRVPMTRPSEPLAFEDAVIVAVQLRSLNHEYWENGRVLPRQPVQAGMTYLHDLKRDPRALVLDPAHTVHFYMPMNAVRTIAEQHEIPWLSDLAQAPLVANDDAMMRRLACAVRAAFDAPYRTTGLLLDQLLNAAAVHVIGRYAAAGSRLRPATGGLAHWQESRAKELMNERMDVTLAELAQECCLSVSHFARAFRQSTGLSPHQWLLARRISKAKSLITGATFDLSEIALECGFSSQSHLSAAFSASLGLSPRQYRQAFALGDSRPAADLHSP